jgi:transposase
LDDEHAVCHRFAAEGAKGLVSKPRGRKPGEQRLLDPAQEAEIEALIRRPTPDELGLPFALWSRAAVRALIARHCGVALAVRTVGKYLARWGFTAQKPIRRAYEQDPAAVRRWLRQDYPEIVKRAKRAHGIVVWGDETGLRADDVRGRSYAPRGRTPVVRVCQTRIKPSLITAVTDRGKLRWMAVDGAVNAPTFLRFLGPPLPRAPDPGRSGQGVPHRGPAQGPPRPSGAGLVGGPPFGDRGALLAVL